MKLLPIFLVLFSLSAKAQFSDSLSLEQKVNYMQKCLVRSDREFRRGTMIFVAGGITAAIGSYLKNNSVSGVGIAVGVLGIGIVFDSHKWIARAGYGPVKIANEEPYQFR